MAASPDAQQPTVTRPAFAHELRVRASAAASTAQANVASAACNAKGLAAAWTNCFREAAATRVASTLSILQEKYVSAKTALSAVCSHANEKAVFIASETKTRSVELTTATKKFAADPAVQITSVSAATGAVAVGTGGAAVGLASGGLVGAALGLVPAVFTLGLSIPLFAAVGAGTGLLSGAVSGGSVGFVGGGAVGYGAYTRREHIGGAYKNAAQRARSLAARIAGSVTSRVSTSAPMVKGGVLEVQTSAKALMSAVRARLVAVVGGGGAGVRPNESRESLLVAVGSQASH